MAVEDKFFIPYIERNVSKPFSNLKPDEQIIAHWALVYKELIKFNYSSLIGCDLDSPMTEKQMKGLSSDKKGGIDWYNYMYSEQYKDNEKLRKDGIKVDGKDPNYWARLSIFEALERFAIVGIGDFIITETMLNFVKAAVASKALTNFNIVRDEKKYEDAFKAAQALKKVFPKMHGHAIISLIGTYGPECAFDFVGSYSIGEFNGTQKSNATGPLDFGESWCGISFWSTKVKIIRNSGVTTCTTDPNQYKPGSGKCIYEQSIEAQAKINAEFLKLQPKWVWEPILEFDPKKHKPEDCIACAFLAKAGCGNLNGKTIWDHAVDKGLVYDKYNSKGDGYHLASPIYHAMMFARYLKDKKVPKGDPWD